MEYLTKASAKKLEESLQLLWKQNKCILFAFHVQSMPLPHRFKSKSHFDVKEVKKIPW